jgi:hypothetical protein
MSSIASPCHARGWFSFVRLVGLTLLVATGSAAWAQVTDGENNLVFTGNIAGLGTLSTSTYVGLEGVVFQPNASFNQGVVINSADIAMTMGSGSSILPPAATAYALRFTSTGGSLVANGATLRASTTGVLNFVNAANATLTDTIIDFTPPAPFAQGGAAVQLQNGGTFTATGGSIAYNPHPSQSGSNHALRNVAGSLALSLTDVAVTVGTTTSHRGYGLDLTGGGTVTLAGTTTVTSRQAEALRLNGAYTVTNAATLTRLDSSGNAAAGAVVLRGGATSFTNQAAGLIVGPTASFAGGALVVNNDAGGSTITNAGTIHGIAPDAAGGAAPAFTVINSGTISSADFTTVDMPGGGLVRNLPTGVISAPQGLAVRLGGIGVEAATLENAGSITGVSGVSMQARAVNVTNSAGATIAGGSSGGTLIGLNVTAEGGSALVTNAGTISAMQGVVIAGSGNVSADETLSVNNSGTITGTNAQGVRIDENFTNAFTRDVVITNQNGGLIQGGTVTPGFYNIASAAVYAGARGNSTITIDNHGTIDARNLPNAIGVSVSDSVQATVTLHSGSTTTGAIRGANPNSSLAANITVAFSGSGTFDGATSGINFFRKADAGTWTHAGERTGGSITVTGGALVLANRELGSSVGVNVTNGTLRLAPVMQTSSGAKNLDAETMSIGTGGRLEVASTARAIVRGNGRVENGGVMVVDGTTTFGSGNLFPASVTTNGLLAGTGRVLGHLRIEAGGIIDAGNGNLGHAGTLNAFETGFIPGTITIGDGGLLRWTLANLSETGAGVNFDQIGLGTNANLLYETGARFVFDFAAFGDGPEVTDAFWHSDRSWEFITGGTVTGASNLLFDVTGLTTYNFAGVGYFTLAGDGRTLDWTADVSAIPEPSTWALLFGGGVLVVVICRRRMTR